MLTRKDPGLTRKNWLISLFIVVLVVNACQSNVRETLVVATATETTFRTPTPTLIDIKPTATATEAAIAAPTFIDITPIIIPTMAGTPDPDARFVVTRESDQNLWLMNTSGKWIKQLTDLPGYEVSPTWSPDGTKIAFRSMQESSDPAEGYGISDIYIINSDGTGLTNLTNDGTSFSPDWSPDGNFLAYSSKGEIALIRVDGTEKLVLTPDMSGEYPAWSPDGKQIAFASFHGYNNWDIFVIDKDGSNLRNLSDNDSYDMYPAWSPDGKHIIFGSDRGASLGSGVFVQNEILSMNTDGTNVTNLTNDVNKVEGFAAWMPDGRIVYSETIQLDQSNYAYKLWIMNADGSNKKEIADDVGFVDCNPAP